MTHRIVVSPEAERDLFEIYDFVAAQAGAVRAFDYTRRISAHCLGLADFPERGTRRNDIRRGLRTIGFERRAAIAFSVADDTVTILRVLYGGRDLAAAFDSDDG